ncbi:MAG: UDP-N-acetylglucosamine 1-carboxyvinyltransferase, partial [Halanaerobium sp.]|nr:UDP-N-acetylglucosamine 1-carboxyvinyltransferase [Halanaerobium sp.]
VGENSGLQGADIHLDFPSVGATENIMMAAVLAKGITVIRNAAKEPEIVDLQNFLNSLGGKVVGAGTDTIKVQGVTTLAGDVDYMVIPDRIEAGTYLLAGAITGGEVWVKNVIPEHLEAILAKLQEMGYELLVEDDRIGINAVGKPNPVDIKTLPYPGFPTDIQPQFMSLLTTVQGISLVTENIFDGRLKHAEELARMGALIQVEGRTAIIKGGRELQGTSVEATALRSGAALVLAGLAASGITRVKNIAHIERGYQDMTGKLTSLGARIRKVD